VKKDWYAKFEWKRWKSDSDLALSSAETRGVWIELLCCMFEKDSDRVTGTLTELARLARVSDSEMQRALDSIRALQIAECNTNGNGSVTLVCRFLQSELKARKNNALRVQRYRENKACNGRVTSDVARHSNSNSNKEPPNPPAGGGGVSGFDRWWAEYPKRRRTGRKKCLALWKANGLEQRADAVIAALKRHRTDPQWTKDGGQFAPMATTYLNQGRYDDDADTEAPGLAISLPPEKVALRDWLLAQTSHARLWLIQEARRRVPDLSRVDDAVMLKTLPDQFVSIVNEYRQKGAA
jgi:hypothetical protein